MEFRLIDFFIGFLLMNAMPHLLFGLIRIRFLSLFGFSDAGNLAYAFINVIAALTLFHIKYGIQQLFNHGIMLGVLTIFLIYLLTGRFFYDRFQ